MCTYIAASLLFQFIHMLWNVASLCTSQVASLVLIAILYTDQSAINASLSNGICFWYLLQIAIEISIPSFFCKYPKLIITEFVIIVLFNAIGLTLLQPSHARSASRSPRSRSTSRSRSPVIASFQNSHLLCCYINFHAYI